MALWRAGSAWAAERVTDIGGAEVVAGWQEHVGVSRVASRVRGHGVGSVRPLGIAPTLGSRLEFAHIDRVCWSRARGVSERGGLARRGRCAIGRRDSTASVRVGSCESE